MINDKRVVAAALIPRFYLGLIYLIAVKPKLMAPHGFAIPLRAFLDNVAMQNAPGWYQAFLNAVVIPHITLFAYAIVAGELFVAIALLGGFATRPAAIVAILLNLDYMFAKGAALWSPASNDGADIMLALVVLFTDPGRIFGLDAMRRSRR